MRFSALVSERPRGRGTQATWYGQRVILLESERPTNP